MNNYESADGFISHWENAMKRDRKETTLSVSSYADTNRAEDFAETFRVYLEGNGEARLPFWRKPLLREELPNRTALLDRVFDPANGGIGPEGHWEDYLTYRRSLNVAVPFLC